MFSLIPKTDAGLWLGPLLVQSTSSSLSISGRLVRADSFFIVPVSSWQYDSHVNYYYALERV